MTVKNVGLVLPRDARQSAPKCRVESAGAAQRRHLYAVSFERLSPRTGIVQATHRHRQFFVQPPGYLHHEPLGAAGIQA
jgi:hypothetical protein